MPDWKCVRCNGIFSEQFRTTPKGWIMRERMSFAPPLLSEGLSNKQSRCVPQLHLRIKLLPRLQTILSLRATGVRAHPLVHSRLCRVLIKNCRILIKVLSCLRKEHPGFWNHALQPTPSSLDYAPKLLHSGYASDANATLEARREGSVFFLTTRDKVGLGWV